MTGRADHCGSVFKRRHDLQPVAVVDVQLAVHQHQVESLTAQRVERLLQIVGPHDPAAELALDERPDRRMIRHTLSDVENAFHGE